MNSVKWAKMLCWYRCVQSKLGPRHPPYDLPVRTRDTPRSAYLDRSGKSSFICQLSLMCPSVFTYFTLLYFLVTFTLLSIISFCSILFFNVLLMYCFIVLLFYCLIVLFTSRLIIRLSYSVFCCCLLYHSSLTLCCHALLYCFLNNVLSSFDVSFQVFLITTIYSNLIWSYLILSYLILFYWP